MSQKKKEPSISELLENGRKWWEEHTIRQALSTLPGLADTMIGYGMEPEMTKRGINLQEYSSILESFVSVSNDETTIEAPTGQSVIVPLKVVYVRSVRGIVRPERVTIRMEPGKSCAPLKRANLLARRDLLAEANKFECGGGYDESVFYNTAKLLSFPNVQNIELSDREINIVNMKITIPSDIPKELIGARISIMPWGKVYPKAVKLQSRGLNIKIVS